MISPLSRQVTGIIKQQKIQIKREKEEIWPELMPVKLILSIFILHRAIESRVVKVFRIMK